MKLNFRDPLIGSKRAEKLGLTSSRFHEDQMGANALAAIQYVKKKDRTDYDLKGWSNRSLYLTDATQQLFDSPDEITRLHAQTLSTQQFVEQYEKTNTPVLIQGCTQSWNTHSFSFSQLYEKYKEAKFKIGEDDDGCKMRVQLKHYLEYLVYNRDDSPLYMFESSLEDYDATKDIINQYTIPPYFRDDLFKLIGQKRRPPYRWMLIGPQRSGSTVHIDPLLTSAWNASLTGHKRWVLFGGHVPKSIVKGKAFRGKDYEDEAINYFTEILPKIRASQDRTEIRMIQFIQRPGDTVFVPGGWWHAVLNLDDTMAITQNIMTHHNFDQIWHSVRCERRKLAQVFLSVLKTPEPELYQRALHLNTIDDYQMGNKYPRQSVSLSFTGSSSSSSSSSSFSSSSSLENITKVKRNSRSLSRSREKLKRNTISEDKVRPCSMAN